MAVRSKKEIIVPVEGKSHGGTVAKRNNCARSRKNPWRYGHKKE
ncbi:hypothetical protein [Neobacillus bataviensis]|nr:hypothetical protein [Neobacillus bataviensis]